MLDLQEVSVQPDTTASSILNILRKAFPRPDYYDPSWPVETIRFKEGQQKVLSYLQQYIEENYERQQEGRYKV